MIEVPKHCRRQLKLVVDLNQVLRGSVQLLLCPRCPPTGVEMLVGEPDAVGALNEDLAARRVQNLDLKCASDPRLFEWT